jgi:hypothetical protein
MPARAGVEVTSGVLRVGRKDGMMGLIKSGSVWRRRENSAGVGGTASAERFGVRLAQEVRNGVNSNILALNSDYYQLMGRKGV